MKIVALYKTWDGGEFVDASLRSIYDFVSAIVMVHSETSWLGERGNTVRDRAKEWCEKFDTAGKVHHVDGDFTLQEQQYQAGLDYIERHKLAHFGGALDQRDAVMVIDADEIWEQQYLCNAIRQIHDNPFGAYRCSMHTYLKTPFFRVKPAYGEPTVFLKEPKLLTESPRACRTRAIFLSDVWMHHYTYVRETRDLVERKIRQSCHADGGERFIKDWMTNFYDRLPEGENLHAFEQHRQVWRQIQKIEFTDLPPAMRDAKLLRLWMPDQHQIFNGETTNWVSLLDGERNAIHRLAQGREQAVDLGTYRGVSAVTLALACRKVHTIDFYEQALADKSSEYFTIGGHSLVNTQAVCDRFGNMTCESADTVEAARRWNTPVDVLFVDAEHTESGTLANVEAWFPHLRNGARIIFHDDIESLPGVQAALNKLRGDSRFRFFDPGPFSGSLAACEVLK